MFSDTHFHFGYLAKSFGVNFCADILKTMVSTDARFGLDIGTKPCDLLSRQEYAKESLDLLGKETREKAKAMLYFSAGIWPAQEAIEQRTVCMATLEDEIKTSQKKGALFPEKLIAIGECGLDHHWNGEGFDTTLLQGERELFLMQIELAQKLALPLIIHSRDAFEETISCLDDAGYHNGIIHCFSYTKEAAEAFLNRGWYLAFGGGTTYTKKRNMAEMEALLRFVPDDRLLLETDAPYLAPVPLRGKQNIPPYISHTYEFIAGIRDISVETLCRNVDINCKKLFNLPD